MASITIYKLTFTYPADVPAHTEGKKTCFSLYPWEQIDDGYAGFDDGGKEYPLPEGWHVKRDHPCDGGYGKRIYTAEGEPVTLCFPGGCTGTSEGHETFDLEIPLLSFVEQETRRTVYYRFFCGEWVRHKVAGL